MAGTKAPTSRTLEEKRTMSTPANGRRGCTFVGAGHASERPRPAVSPDLINTLAGRLSARDLWLLELLHEHRVLTTGQIRELAFNTISAATHRMLTLWRLCAVERFRPPVPTGSEPLHRLIHKIGDYQTLAEMTGINHTPVLFALPNPAREQHLHTRTHTTNTTLLIATTTPNALQAAGGPAGPAWWPIATPKGTRRRLINLTRPHTPRGADAPAGHPTGDSRGNPPAPW